MDSPPPPIATSTPSKITERAASAIACRPDAHWRSIVVPAVVTGRPARNSALRAMLVPVGPCCRGQPFTTSSTSVGSTFARDNAAEIAWPSRVAPSVLLRAPLYALPIGVRAVETITASVIVLPLVGYDSRYRPGRKFSFAARTASDDRQDRQTGC